MNPTNSLKEKENKTESNIQKYITIFIVLLQAHITSITESKLSIHYDEYKSYNLKKTLLRCKRISDFE